MIYPFFSVEISAVIWVEGSWLTDLGIKVFHIPLLHFFLSWATVVLNLCPGEKRVCSSTPKKLRHFSFSFLFPFFFCHLYNMWKFPGWGSNTSHGKDNAEALITRTPGNSLSDYLILFNIKYIWENTPLRYYFPWHEMIS